MKTVSKDSTKEQSQKALAEGELTDEQLEQTSGGTAASEQMMHLDLQNSMQKQSQAFSSMAHVTRMHQDSGASVVKKIR